MKDVDLVVSALGITRQRDGLTYQDVDYQANKNLLDEAVASGVKHFCYVHVYNGEMMSDLGVKAVQAKQNFVEVLAKTTDIKSSVICPTGFFSDMKDFLDMAQSGRVFLFGDGTHKINPIHGADLACATADAVDAGIANLNVGGPDTFTHRELAELAFSCLDVAPARITYLPDWIRTLAIRVAPWVTPTHIGAPLQFFLTAFGYDMVGEKKGHRRLKDFFAETLLQAMEVNS